jgi:hypothetical protein
MEGVLDMRNRTLAGKAVLVTLLLAAVQAGASLMTDNNGMGGQWQGKRTFTATMNLFNADVEFCVYAPGQFNKSFTGADPSGGLQYVYAYQVINTGATGYLNRFSVGLNEKNEQASNIGQVAGSNVSPSANSITTTTAGWDFLSPTIIVGQRSNILIFTSPFAPEFDNTTVKGTQGATKTIYRPPTNLGIPSPTPEPMTLTLLATGLVAAISRRK